jgi:hypothetical protein
VRRGNAFIGYLPPSDCASIPRLSCSDVRSLNLHLDNPAACLPCVCSLFNDAFSVSQTI